MRRVLPHLAWWSLHLGAASLAVGCGAAAKKTSEVQSIFTTAPTLGEKTANLCQVLATRDAAPTTKILGFKIGDCSDAGSRATNYSSATSFNMTRFDATPAGQDPGDVQNIAARGQMWLNRSLLQLLPLVAKLAKLAPTAGSGGDGTGMISMSSQSTMAFSGLATPTITMTETPSFDMGSLTFSAKMHVSITGAVKVELDLDIAGGLVENAIAVTITSRQPDPPYATSLLKNIQILALVVPFANDVYVDLSVDLNLYNLGVPAAVDSAANTLFGTAFKSIADGILQP